MNTRLFEGSALPALALLSAPPGSRVPHAMLHPRRAGGRRAHGVVPGASPFVVLGGAGGRILRA